MYTHRALFSRIFLQICLFVLSLYVVGRMVTVSCETSVQAPVICVNSHRPVHVESEVKVWSVYIRNVNRIMRFRDMAV